MNGRHRKKVLVRTHLAVAHNNLDCEGVGVRLAENSRQRERAKHGSHLPALLPRATVTNASLDDTTCRQSLLLHFCIFLDFLLFWRKNTKQKNEAKSAGQDWARFPCHPAERITNRKGELG